MTQLQPPAPRALDPLPRGTQPLIRSGIAAVAYHIPTAPPGPDQSILKTTIALPARSVWTSGLHFHTAHTEYLRLIRGSIFVELNGEKKVISAKAGGEVSAYTGEVVKSGVEIEIGKCVRHNWGRADACLNELFDCRMVAKLCLPEDGHEEVIIEEWTDPQDIGKPLFFWNLNEVITQPPSALPTVQRMARKILGDWWIPFQVFDIFWELDNWPVLLSLDGVELPFVNRVWRQEVGRVAEYTATFVILIIASTLAKLLGIDAVSKDRTPKELWNAYERDGL